MDDIALIRKTLYAFGSMPDAREKAKRSIGNLTMSAIHSVNMADVGLQVKIEMGKSNYQMTHALIFFISFTFTTAIS